MARSVAMWVLGALCCFALACEQNECNKDGDCSATYRCIETKCFAPGTCQKDAHCLFGFACKNQQCIDTRCKDNSGCSADKFCNAGFCQNRGNIGEVCTKDSPCQSGMLCITLEDSGGKARCFQDCTKDVTICAANTANERTHCLPFALSSSGLTLSVCLGIAKQNESCSLANPKQKLCESGHSPPLFCSTSKGVCTQATVRNGILEFCSTTYANRDPLQICDQDLGLYCSEATGFCEKTTNIAKIGEPCDPNGQVTGTPTLCTPGTQCIAFDREGLLKRCTPTCNPTQTDSCAAPNQAKCITLFRDPNVGLCLSPCQKDDDCGLPNYTCRKQPDQSGLCIPDFPPGTRSYGEVCAPSSTTPDTNCQKALFCLTVLGSGVGVCSQRCTQSSDCPGIQDAGGKALSSQCTQVQPDGTKACTIPCSSQSCPTQLECKPFEKGICLAP